MPSKKYIAKIAQLVELDLAPKDQKRSDLGKEINEKEFSGYQQIHIAKIAQLVEHDLAPKDQTRSDLGKGINEKEFSGYQQIHIAKIAQLVEHDLAKVGVAGSSPVFRSRNKQRNVRVSLFFSKVESKFINCPNGGIGRHASFRDQWP